MPNGKEGEFNYMHKSDAVMIIPIFDDGSIGMVR